MKPATDFSELIREIRGYSAPGVLGLLNHYVSRLAAPFYYVEVGSFYGLTLVGALLGNTARALAIDNFSQFGGSESALRATLARYRLSNRVELLSMDFRKVFTQGKLPPQSVGVYFYDGQHTKEAQNLGLKLAEPFLAPNAIVIVDDTNWPAPRQAVEHWIKEHGLKVLENIHTKNFRTSPFWNGLIVCRWKKGNESPRNLRTAARRPRTKVNP